MRPCSPQLPATLALAHLHVKFFWHWLTEKAGGDGAAGATGDDGAAGGGVITRWMDAIVNFDIADVDQLLEGNENLLIGILTVLLTVVLLARQLHTHMEQERQRRQAQRAEERQQRQAQREEQRQQRQAAAAEDEGATPVAPEQELEQHPPDN